MNLMDKIYQMQNEMYRKYYVQPTKVFMNKVTRDALKAELQNNYISQSFDTSELDMDYEVDLALNMELRIDENLSDGMILLSE